MNGFFSLTVRPRLQALAILANVVVLGGIIGFPNTMRFDTWLGRTAADTVTIGDGAATSIIQGGTNRDLSIRQPGNNKQIISFYSGNGAGANADHLDLSSDGMTFQNAAGQQNITGSGTQNVCLKAGAAGTGALLTGNNGDGWTCTNGNCSLTVNALTDIDTTAGILNFPNGANVHGKGLVTTLTLENQAAIVATNVQTNVFVWKGSSSATVSECRYTVDVIGAVGGTCTYELWNATGSAAVCTVSQACTAAVGASATCTTGTLTNGSTYDFKVTAPGGDTSARGSLICEITE